MPNSSLSSRVSGQRGAVERDKRLARPRAVVVDRLGGKFLAGSAFAGDQHIDHTIADALHEPHYLLNALARPDDAMRGVAALHFAPEMGVLLREFVLIAPKLADQLGGLDGDRGMRSERSERFLVARGKDLPTRLLSASKAPMISPCWLRTATASRLRVR